MKLQVHRGTRQIGGTSIELESAGSRVLLDFGLPLDSPDVASAALPTVPGLQEPDAKQGSVG